MVAGYANHAAKSADAGSRAGIRDGAATLQQPSHAIGTRHLSMNRIAVVLPYPPSVNRMWRSVNGRNILSREGRLYRTRVAALCHGLQPMGGDVRVQVWAFRPRKAGDLDNIFKGLLDSVRGALFFDDSQVVELEAKRYDDKANPRVEVAVTYMGLNQ